MHEPSAVRGYAGGLSRSGRVEALRIEMEARLTTMRDLQEEAHGSGHSYKETSPHLRHQSLSVLLKSVLEEAVRALGDSGMPLTVLEVGAGHGGYTEPTLAAGCEVTATEMSRPSLDRLERRFGHNGRFHAYADDDGSLDVLGDAKFSMILCSSVLHHIPDYLGFIEGPVMKHLAVGGTFLTFQDPLWYPTVGRTVRRMDRASYLFWRLTRGNYKQGLSTLRRRAAGVFDESNPADMVEYHVVRQGVNHLAIESLTQKHFRSVELLRYWSAHSSVCQLVGEMLPGVENSFAVGATGFLADG